MSRSSKRAASDVRAVHITYDMDQLVAVPWLLGQT